MKFHHRTYPQIISLVFLLAILGSVQSNRGQDILDRSPLPSRESPRELEAAPPIPLPTPPKLKKPAEKTSPNQSKPLTVTIDPDEDIVNTFEKVIMTAKPTGGKPPYSYAWYSGDKKIDMIDPSVVWILKSPGTRVYRVVVTDAAGSTAEARAMAIARLVGAPDAGISAAAEWGEQARLALAMGKNEEALDYCEKGIELEPERAELYSLKGQALTAKKQHGLGLESFDRAIKLEPTNGSFYYKRAVALKELGRERDALVDLDKAAALTPGAVRSDIVISVADNVVKEQPSTTKIDRSAPSPTQIAREPGRIVRDPSFVTASAKSSSDGARVLTPFSGYDTADTCSALNQRLAGVPWSDGKEESGPVGSAQSGQYNAMLRNTMRGLRLFYGDLTPAEDKSFNAFWAPFFDHPTAGALEYFQKINPLLDEMAVTVNRLDGMLADLGGAMQETVITIGDSDSGGVPVAEGVYKSVKAERAKLDDLYNKVNELGNPPNPLASKCAARTRHKKAIGGGPDVLEEIKKSNQMTSWVYLQLKLASGNVHKEFRDDLNEWEWVGNTFKFASQSNQAVGFNYNSPDCSGLYGGSHRQEATGTMSPDGRTIERLQIKTLMKYCDTKTKQIVGPRLEEEAEVINVPLYALNVKPDRATVTYGLKGSEVKKHITSLTPAIEYDHKTDDYIKIQLRSGDHTLTPAEASKLMAEITAIVKGAGGGSKDPFEGVADPSSKDGGTAPNYEKDSQITAEAVAQHEALADQIRKNAERWASDAARERDPERKKELLKRAVEMRANAQAEQDLADSIRTGTIVHTRTEWDEQQHQALVESIKTELEVFDAEHKLITNIPRVGDMIAGAEGVQARAQLQQQISDAIRSPDAVQKLSAIYSGLQNKVKDQGEQQIADAQAKVEMWDRRIAVAEGVKTAAGAAITLGALWAPVALGSLALGYAGATGFAEDGVKGGTVAVIRSVSNKADVIISAYEGAVKIDPETGEPGGAWGAMESALWTIGTNKVMDVVGGKIQKAKADYALARQAAGAPGVKPVARATREGRLKEYDFRTPEQRYKNELSAAKSPEQIAAVNKKHAIQAERDAMNAESMAALKKAEDTVRSGTDPVKAKEQYNKDLNAINEKYAAKETRNQEHQDVLKELGYDSNTDIKSTGSDPKTAASDMDFTPQGNTPHEAYQKGKQYTDALQKRGHNVVEYGDRWVDTTTDATIWKPGFGADKPGSSSFEAEVIFGTMPHSDKFGTKGGVEWTSSPTHATDDPLGAVLANTGKAVGAGLGNSKPVDLHTVGKSAGKAAEAAGVPVDPQLKSQIDALRAHQTPEQAGIVTLGADQATKDKQLKAFLGKVESLMASAYKSAKAKSDENLKVLEQKAAAAGNTDEGYKIRAQIKAYQAGDDAALTTISQVSPGLVAKMAPAANVSDLVPATSGGKQGMLNFGGLAKELVGDRESAAKASPLPADGAAPAFAGLDARCREGAKRVEIKLAAAKPGSADALYLVDLKAALLQGGKNPAEAVRSVRGISGTELVVVLAQLGVPTDAGKRP